MKNKETADNQPIIKKKNFEIDLGGQDWFLISCYNHYLCNKLKEIFGTYKDYRFKAGEEATFRMKSSEILKANVILKLAGRDLKKLDSSMRSFEIKS